MSKIWEKGALPRLFLGVFLLSLAFQSGSRPVNDGYAAIVVAEGLIDEGDWTYYPGYSPGYSVLGPDGEAYGKFGLGMSLLVAPSLWVGKVLSLGVEDPVQSSVLQAVALRVPLALMTALLFVLLVGWGRVWMSLSPRVALLLAFLTIVCTPVWVYLRVFYAEGLLTLALMAVWVLNTTWQTHASWKLLAFSGAMAGVGMLAKPIGILLLPAGCLLLMHRGDRLKGILKKSVVFGLGALPMVGLALAYNAVRTGSPFGSTYTEGIDQFGFSTPFLEGSWGLIASPGKGMLFFSPLALLGAYGWLRCPNPLVKIVTLGLSGVFFLVSSLWWAWHGGECWGPRLLVPIIPLLAFGTAFLVRSRGWRPLLTGAVVAGGIVSCLGVAIPWQAHYDRVPYQTWAEAMHEASPDAGVEVLGKDNLKPIHESWTFSGIPAHTWLLFDLLGDSGDDPPWGKAQEYPPAYGLNSWAVWPEQHQGIYSSLLFALLCLGGAILGGRGVSLFVR